jgi:hypothetical protein
MTLDGRWRFNSSVAEQTNAWFGGFLSIVREMQVNWYNFFLNEMISHQNMIMVKDLRRKQQAPYSIYTTCRTTSWVASDDVTRGVFDEFSCIQCFHKHIDQGNGEIGCF